VPEQDRAPATSGRDRGEKAPPTDSGAPGSLFTPRVPAQPPSAKADRERAKEAAPAGAGDPGPADTSKPGVSREAEDLIPAGRIPEQDGTREARDPDRARDADAAEDTRPADRAAGSASDGDGDGAGDLGSGDRAGMATDAGDAPDASKAGDASVAGDLDDAGDLDAKAADGTRDTGEPAAADEVRPPAAAAAKDAPAARDADEPADDKPDTSAARAGEASPGRSAGDASPGRSAGEATPDRKPAPAGDRDQKPGEKPDKPGTDEKGGSGATPLDGEVTVVPGVSRYHRRGCILIRFLSDGDLETMTRGEAETAGSIPCKACQPDKPLSES
jgi:hypothetical protein